MCIRIEILVCLRSGLAGDEHREINGWLNGVDVNG